MSQEHERLLKELDEANLETTLSASLATATAGPAPAPEPLLAKLGTAVGVQVEVEGGGPGVPLALAAADEELADGLEERNEWHLLRLAELNGVRPLRHQSIGHRRGRIIGGSRTHQHGIRQMVGWRDRLCNAPFHPEATMKAQTRQRARDGRHVLIPEYRDLRLRVDTALFGSRRRYARRVSSVSVSSIKGYAREWGRSVSASHLSRGHGTVLDTS